LPFGPEQTEEGGAEQNPCEKLPHNCWLTDPLQDLPKKPARKDQKSDLDQQQRFRRTVSRTGCLRPRRENRGDGRQCEDERDCAEGGPSELFVTHVYIPDTRSSRALSSHHRPYWLSCSGSVSSGSDN